MSKLKEASKFKDSQTALSDVLFPRFEWRLVVVGRQDNGIIIESKAECVDECAEPSCERSVFFNVYKRMTRRRQVRSSSTSSLLLISVLGLHEVH